MQSEYDYRPLYEQLGYTFADESLLTNALTHSSYSHEIGARYRDNNERLEFLGDAFFDAVIAEELYLRLAENEEGDLSRYRAQIVCERSLLRKAEELSLLEYIRMGHGELRAARQHRKTSITADAMEAVLGAIYLDGGYEAVRGVVRRLFADTVEGALAGRLNADFKSAIHERVQAQGGGPLQYRVARESGPDHDKTFFVELESDGRVIGRGSGKNKKQAEQAAAEDALERMP